MTRHQLSLDRVNTYQNRLLPNDFSARLRICGEAPRGWVSAEWVSQSARGRPGAVRWGQRHVIDATFSSAPVPGRLGFRSKSRTLDVRLRQVHANGHPDHDGVTAAVPVKVEASAEPFGMDASTTVEAL
ncbi:hypothetical protein ACVWXU_001224 [Streptomyces sp. TE33382]